MFKGIIDILTFRGQPRKIAANICSHFILTMDTFVLLDVECNSFRYRVVMSKNAAAKGAELCAVVRKYFFHNVGF